MDTFACRGHAPPPGCADSIPLRLFVKVVAKM